MGLSMRIMSLGPRAARTDEAVGYTAQAVGRVTGVDHFAIACLRVP